MSTISTLLRCLLVPLQRSQIVVPSTSIAEVVPYTRPNVLGDGPSWLQGTLEWHGESVPAVDLDTLFYEDQGERASKSRWAMVRRVGADLATEHYAILARSLPRLLTLERHMMEPFPRSELPLAALSMVKIGGQRACVPNLPYIETTIAGSMLPFET